MPHLGGYMKKILELKNITKYYGNENNITKAVDNVSFNVKNGEFIAIMGTSGSGKSTILNCISTIDKVTSGSIIVDGEDINRIRENKLSSFRNKKLGFVFQDFNILDTLTGYDNIALSLCINHVNHKLINKKIIEIAEVLDIKQVLKKYPYQMSGGQKQRIAVARAIINDPSLLLADEPTGQLDSKSSKLLLDKFKYLNNMGSTIIMVTHDAFTASYANRIIFIKDGKKINELKKNKDSDDMLLKRIIKEVEENIINV